MGILSWVVLGLVVGVLTQYLLSGKGSKNILVTILLGIAGAFVGGTISSLLGFGSFTGWNVKSLLIAVCGAVVVVLAWNKIVK